MLGAIYARYSPGPNQTDQSIEGQVADCMEYAQKNNIQIVEIYADRHLSGKTLEGRSEFKRMLKDATAGKFQHVICWKIDRFGRNRTDIAMSKLELKKASVKLHYAKENVPDTPEGIILESLLEGLAEYYSADLKQKVSRGIRESAKKGRAHGGILPLGYKLDENRHPVVDEHAASLVREVFAAHIAGCSTDAMLDILIRGGVTTPKGNKPTRNTIFRMLRQERYTGNWEIMGVQLDVEPIISKETFEEAKKHFKTSRQNGRGKALVNYLLSGKCICGYCGSSVVGVSATSHTGAIYNYYKCSKKKCELKAVPFKKLEGTILEETVRNVLTDDMVEYLADRIMEIQESDSTSALRTSLQKRISEAKKKQDNLIRVIEQTGNAALVERLEAAQKDEADLKLELAQTEIKSPVIPRKAVAAWLKHFASADYSDEAACKKLVETFIHHIDLRNDEAVIYYNYQEKTSGTLGSYTARQMEQLNSNTNLFVTDRFIIFKISLV